MICRSTTLAFDGESVRQSIMTEDGRHLVIEYGPAQIMLLNKQFAAYVCDHVKLAEPI